MFKTGILLFSLLLAVNINAGEYTGNRTLDSLIQSALERNPDLKAAGYQRDGSVSKGRYTGSLEDPQLSVGFLNLPKNSLSLSETPMSGVQFGISQMLPWPGKLSTKTEIVDLSTEIANMNIQEIKNRLARLVSQNYYEYAYSENAGKILKAYITKIETIIDIAETKYSNGEASIQDVLRAETWKAKLTNKLIELNRVKDDAYSNILFLTDSYDSVNNSFSAVLPQQIDYKPAELNDDNPALTKAGLMLEISKKKLKLAKLSNRPNFMLGVDYRIRKEMMMDAVNGEDFLTFKFALNLPLWSLTKKKHKIAEARYEIQSFGQKQKSISNDLNNRITNLKLSLESLSKRCDEYNKVIMPQAIAASEAAKVAYEVGQVDFNGYLSSELTLLDIELEKIDLIKKFYQQKAVLIELTENIN